MVASSRLLFVFALPDHLSKVFFLLFDVIPANESSESSFRRSRTARRDVEPNFLLDLSYFVDRVILKQSTRIFLSVPYLSYVEIVF